MNFKKALQKKREAAVAQPPAPKDPSLMSEEELDREVERHERDTRTTKEQFVRAAREERNAITTPRRLFLPNRKRRRYWK